MSRLARCLQIRRTTGLSVLMQYTVSIEPSRNGEWMGVNNAAKKIVSFFLFLQYRDLISTKQASSLG